MDDEWCSGTPTAFVLMPNIYRSKAVREVAKQWIETHGPKGMGVLISQIVCARTR